MLSRRQLVAGAGAAGLGLLAGCGRLPGQVAAPKLARIGMLVPYAAESRRSGELIEPFRAGLHELGYVEGQNIVLEYRFSGGQNERLPELAAELVRLPVDLIVAEKQGAILAAKEATDRKSVV